MLIKKHCLSHCRSSPVSFSLPHCLNVYPSNLPLIPSSFLTFYVCLLPQPPFHSLSMVPTFPTLSLPCSSSCFSLLPPSFLFISMSIPLVPVFTGFSSPLPSLSRSLPVCDSQECGEECSQHVRSPKIPLGSREQWSGVFLTPCGTECWH